MFASLLIALSGAPLSTSVSLFRESQVLQCKSELAQVKALGSPGVNFVLNQYVKLDEKGAVESFCYARANGRCEILSPLVASDLSEELKTCFSEADRLGLEISILPHVDDIDGHKWRNGIHFDPKVERGGSSYFEGFLKPIRDALLSVRPSKPVYFAMQGEMGTSVFENSNSYLEIYRELKNELGKNAKIGLSFNYNSIDGQEKVFDETNALFSAVDFVGISAYRGLSPRPRPGEFDTLIDEFYEELGRKGVKLSTTKEIVFSEVGIGGGTIENDGVSISRNYSEALSVPYSGIYSGRYRIEFDPWQKDFNRKARRDYYSTLVAYLSGKKRYNLTRAYLWSVGSWDFQGVYDGAENYSDSFILEKVKAHNLRFEQQPIKR
jgi:hypothetical protein